MPPKVRELISELQRVGFVDRGGKGSHRNFVHPCETLSNSCGACRSRGIEQMKDSAKYAKIVEWSEEDQCYVGSAPGLLLGGCHGDDEKKVFDELCSIVEETIELYHKDSKPLPPATSGHDFANRMQNVA